MTTFHFVRHGRREERGPGDSPLTVEGRAQAQKAAVALANRTITKVYTSPLLCALKTAEIIANPHGLPTSQCSLLRERASWGDLPDQTKADFVAMWSRCNRERAFVPAVGDSSIEAGRRLERFVRLICEQESDGLVVAVTHGAVLADFLRNIFSLEELEGANAGFARRPYSGDGMRECSITTVRALTLGLYELVRLASTDLLSHG